VTRFFQALYRQFARGLAITAVIAFMLDGALALDRHLGESLNGSVYHGTHVHLHLPHAAPHHHAHDCEAHQAASGGVGAGAADANDSSPAPASGPDAGCCFASCYLGAMIACPGVEAIPLALRANPPMLRRNGGDGFEPEGLRRPPRPGAIA
jgi:hypothetical protein